MKLLSPPSLSRMQLVYEEEAEGSSIFQTQQSELCPLLDGDMFKVLAARKGARAVRITFNGHIVLASNETFAQLLYKKTKWVTGGVYMNRMLTPPSL